MSLSRSAAIHVLSLNLSSHSFLSFSKLKADKIATLLKAAKVGLSDNHQGKWISLNNIFADVEPFWPTLFAKALEGQNIGSLISNIGSGFIVFQNLDILCWLVCAGSAPAPAAATAAPAATAAAPKAEEKKAAPKKKTTSEDGDMGFGLFD